METIFGERFTEKEKWRLIMNKEELKALPKIELHCHLDGSLSRGFLEKHLGRSVDLQEIHVSDSCESLAEYLEKFDLPVQCLQDREGLSEAGYDVLRSMSEENICYGEVRFAPLLSAEKGLSCSRIIEAVLSGMEKAKKELGISYGLITCAMRHHSPEDNLKMLHTAREYLGAGVCGADLAGAEAMYPMSGFMELFREVRKTGMPFTLHAGECGSAENIRDSIEAGAGRIGHGIAMGGNPETEELVKKRGIGVEMCPISNLQTKAVKNEKEYPLREFLDQGIRVSINTDNRTVSNTTLTRELEFIQTHYHISDEEILLMMRNGVETAFADDDMKDHLLRIIR